MGDIFLNFVGSKGVSSEGLENVRKICDNFVARMRTNFIKLGGIWKNR